MRILSGIQPSGKLHIGNYFAMMKPALELQAEGEVYLFIADYHALTTVHDPEALREGVLDVALDFLACGLDPEKTVFYCQSDVPEVLELSWLLSIITPMGLLERAHSYKDKIARGTQASHALFSYPVLMTADILAVQADRVPVGHDQKQHLEMARDIAQKFNNEFGEVFKIPEPSIREDVALVPGIDGQKMSKSYNNTIDIFGSPKETKKNIMSIVTDSKTVEDPKDPDTCNVFALYKLFATPGQAADMKERYTRGGMGYGLAKKELLGLYQETMGSFQEKRETLANDPEGVKGILEDGAARARSTIRGTLDKAREAVGLEEAWTR